MADTFNDRRLAREEWEAADKEMKLKAYVLAECYVTFDTAPLRDGIIVTEYRAARDAERAAWNRYMGIAHADEEVSA